MRDGFGCFCLVWMQETDHPRASPGQQDAAPGAADPGDVAGRRERRECELARGAGPIHARRLPFLLGWRVAKMWRRCMGVEPTRDRSCGRATVLKTAKPTGTLPPPRPVEQADSEYGSR